MEIQVIVEPPYVTGIHEQSSLQFPGDGKTVFHVGFQFHGADLAGDGEDVHVFGGAGPQGTRLPAAHGHGTARVELLFYGNGRGIAIRKARTGHRMQGQGMFLGPAEAENFSQVKLEPYILIVWRIPDGVLFVFVLGKD